MPVGAEAFWIVPSLTKNAAMSFMSWSDRDEAWACMVLWGRVWFL